MRKTAKELQTENDQLARDNGILTKLLVDLIRGNAAKMVRHGKTLIITRPAAPSDACVVQHCEDGNGISFGTLYETDKANRNAQETLSMRTSESLQREYEALCHLTEKAKRLQLQAINENCGCFDFPSELFGFKMVKVR